MKRFFLWIMALGLTIGIYRESGPFTAAGFAFLFILVIALAWWINKSEYQARRFSKYFYRGRK